MKFFLLLRNRNILYRLVYVLSEFLRIIDSIVSILTFSYVYTQLPFWAFKLRLKVMKDRGRDS